MLASFDLLADAAFAGPHPEPVLGLGRLGRLQRHRRLVDRSGRLRRRDRLEHDGHRPWCTRRRAAAGPSTPPAPPSAASPRPTTTGGPPDRHARDPTPRRPPSAPGRRPSPRAPRRATTTAQRCCVSANGVDRSRTASGDLGRAQRRVDARARRPRAARVNSRSSSTSICSPPATASTGRARRVGIAARSTVSDTSVSCVDRARRGVGHEFGVVGRRHRPARPPRVGRRLVRRLDRGRRRPLLPHDAAHGRSLPAERRRGRHPTGPPGRPATAAEVSEN